MTKQKRKVLNKNYARDIMTNKLIGNNTPVIIAREENVIDFVKKLGYLVIKPRIVQEIRVMAIFTIFVMAVILFLNVHLVSATLNATDANLVGVYQMSETSGTAVYDALGRYNGTSTNMQLQQTGINGYAWNCNGASSRATVPIHFTTTDVSAISVWFNKNTSSSGNAYILGIRYTVGGDDDRGLSLGTSGAPLFYSRYQTGDAGIINMTNVTTASWHNLIAIENTSGAFIYLDGVMAGNNSATRTFPTLATRNISICARNNNAVFDNYLNSEIDELYLFNRSLTNADIAQLSNSSNVGAFYPFPIPVVNITVSIFNTNPVNFAMTYDTSAGLPIVLINATNTNSSVGITFDNINYTASACSGFCDGYNYSASPNVSIKAGNHSLYAWAYNTGNFAITSNTTFRVDKSPLPPVTALILPSNTVYNDTRLNITAICPNNNANCSLWIGQVNYTSPFVSTLPAGVYNITIDYGGNENYTSFNYTTILTVIPSSSRLDKGIFTFDLTNTANVLIFIAVVALTVLFAFYVYFEAGCIAFMLEGMLLIINGNWVLGLIMIILGIIAIFI